MRESVAALIHPGSPLGPAEQHSTIELHARSVSRNSLTRPPTKTWCMLADWLSIATWLSANTSRKYHPGGCPAALRIFSFLPIIATCERIARVNQGAATSARQGSVTRWAHQVDGLVPPPVRGGTQKRRFRVSRPRQQLAHANSSDGPVRNEDVHRAEPVFRTCGLQDHVQKARVRLSACWFHILVTELVSRHIARDSPGLEYSEKKCMAYAFSL